MQLFFVFLWSSGAPLIVIGLRYVNPFSFLLWRLIIAAIFMLGICLVVRAPWPKGTAAWRRTITIGLLIQFAYLASYFCALYHGVNPVLMAIVLALQPILTAIISNFVFRDKTSKHQYLGLGIGLLGVIFTVSHNLSTHAMTFIGAVFAITCVSSITVGSILQKKNTSVDLRTGTFIQFIAGLIPLFILNAFKGSWAFPIVFPVVFPLLWMGLVVSVGAVLLYFKLLRDGNAVKVNSLFYLVPGMTAILCYFFFGETLDRYMILGIILIVVGVLMAQKRI